MSFLLDTDTCSAHLKTMSLTTRFVQYGGRLHISALSVGELFTWALRRGASPKRLITLRTLLQDVAILDVTPAIGEKFGELRAQRLDAGQSAPVVDLLIAATALVHGLTLVTHNVHDFANIPGLAVQDWLSP